jgi:hypothetical protein
MSGIFPFPFFPHDTVFSHFRQFKILNLILIASLSLLCYIYLMIIEQTIEIPVNRRIFLDLPRELPVGKAKVELTITPESATQGKTVRPLASLLGIDKGRDTMDTYFARKRADKAKEDAQFERMRQP